MTSTTTLRRGDTSAAIEVPPALLMVIASPRPPQRHPWAPARRIGLSYALPRKGPRYLRQVVDRHVHKASQPVDDDRAGPGRLWTPARVSLATTASAAV